MWHEFFPSQPGLGFEHSGYQTEWSWEGYTAILPWFWFTWSNIYLYLFWKSEISQDMDSQTITHSYNGCDRSQNVPSYKKVTFAYWYIRNFSNRFHVLQDESSLKEGPENLENVNGTDCHTEDKRVVLSTSECTCRCNITRNDNSICNGDVDSILQMDCVKYEACKAQNGLEFRSIPLSPIKLYTGDPKYWETIPDIFTAHKLLRQIGLPNVLGLRIPVATQLNVKAWRHYLCNY